MPRTVRIAHISMTVRYNNVCVCVCAANRDKTEVDPRSSKNQAQYEYCFIVIENVKVNVIGKRYSFLQPWTV